MRLSVEHGSFSYWPDAPVLKDVSFAAGPGDLVAILGPNGAGKTTLLRCMMGFLRWSSGRSLLDEKDIRTIPHRKLWQALAYVPQAKGAAVAYTVEEMVLLGRASRCGYLGQPSREDLKEARQVMERLGLTALAKRRCTELSGGQLQMVLIARALAARPQVLILDEPESNLDFRNQLLVLDTLSELAREGLTCLFNTHYPAHALQRANRSLLLGADGETRFGDTAQVVTEANLQSAFGVRAVIGEIETPYRMVRDVVPLEAADGSAALTAEDGRAIAVVAIITTDYEEAGQINALLHTCKPYIVGRMGMPYPDGGVFIINVTLDAPETVVRCLVGQLERLPGVSVKTTFARPEQERGGTDRGQPGTAAQAP